MVKYVVTENEVEMPPLIESDTIKGIVEQVQKFTKHKLKHSAVEDIIVFRYPKGKKNQRFCLLTRVKPVLVKRTDLDYLNELRAAKGKVPLSNWFSGAAALAMAIAHEQGKKVNQAEEILAVMSGKIPPIEYVKPGVARGAYKTKEEAKIATGTMERKLKWKKKDLPAHRIVTPEKKPRGDGTSAASVLEELGIDPRKGRALLRKNNIARDDPAAIRAFFKERGK